MEKRKSLRSQIASLTGAAFGIWTAATILNAGCSGEENVAASSTLQDGGKEEVSINSSSATVGEGGMHGTSGMGGFGGYVAGNGGNGGSGGAIGGGGIGGLSRAGGAGGMVENSGGGMNGCTDPCQGPGTLLLTHIQQPDEQYFQMKYIDLEENPQTTFACGTMGVKPCQKVIFSDYVSIGLLTNMQVTFIPEGELMPNPTCFLEGFSFFNHYPNDPPYLLRMTKGFQLNHEPLSVSGFQAYPPPNLMYTDSPVMQIKVAESCPLPHGSFVDFP